MKFQHFFEVIFITTFKLKLNLAADSHGIVSFSFTDFKTCLTVTELNFLTAFSKISIAQCASECEKRPDCQALNYHRLFKICELLSSDSGVLTNNEQTRPCVMMTKPHVTTFRPCSCTTGEVCSGPKCETKECPKLSETANTKIVGNLNSVGSRVLLGCSSGYVNIGEDYSACLPNGTWDHQPLCVVDCGQPKTALGASISYTVTTEGSTVVYTCPTGFTHTGGDLVHVCSSKGLWVGTLPTCTIDCGQPKTALGASISYTVTTEGSTVVYTCPTGFTHTGGDLVHVCSSKGLWVGTLPTCTIDCLEPPTVSSSVISTGNTYEGNQRTYTCDSGKFFYTGANTITTICQSDGEWSNMGIICPSGVVSSVCPGCGILRDCEDVQSLGATQTGTYVIYPVGNAVTVRCDMDTSSGGWTVIQRRISDSDFHKTWTEYKNGFGNIAENFWLGNDNIATLTGLGSYKIRFDMYDLDDVYGYAEYSMFSLTPETGNYGLSVSGYSGTAGDSFSSHSGMMFSTKDVDNDISSTTHCATYYSGAWWFSKCFNCNLNGIYGSTELGKGVNWAAFRGIEYSLPKTEMKIKQNL